MWGFLQNYGLWILLGVIFLAMQRFGLGCCGGHDHGSGRGRDGEGEEAKLQRKGAGQSDRR